MSELVTQEELKSVNRNQTDEIVAIFQSFMQQVDDRFKRVEKEISELKESHNRLLNTIDGFIGRIDKN